MMHVTRSIILGFLTMLAWPSLGHAQPAAEPGYETPEPPAPAPAPEAHPCRFYFRLGGAFIKFALEFCDHLLGIVCWVVRCLSHDFLLILPRDLVEATYPKRPTAAVVQC